MRTREELMDLIAQCANETKRAHDIRSAVLQCWIFIQGIHAFYRVESLDDKAISSWIGLLSGCEPGEIVEAFVAHAKDSRFAKCGRRRADIIPTPGQILGRVRHLRKIAEHGGDA